AQPCGIWLRCRSSIAVGLLAALHLPITQFHLLRQGLTLPFSGAVNGNKRTMRDLLRGLRCNGLLDSLYCRYQHSSRRYAPLTPQPRGPQARRLRAALRRWYLTTDDSRTANAACAASRHVSVCVSDLLR